MTFIVEFLGLYLLAASMQQHRQALLGGHRRVAGPRTVAAAGWLVLLLSFGLAVGGGRATDIVTWFGLLPLAGGMILLGLSFVPHLMRAVVVALLVGGLVAIVLG